MSRRIFSIAGIALMAFQASGCFNPKDYDNIKPAGIIEFTTNNTMVPADGASSYTVQVKISSDAAKGKRTVVFKTTLGSFKGGTADSIKVDADTNFVCTAKLTSVKIGVATISAKILNVQAARGPDVTFSQAFPANITVSVDSFAIKNSFQSHVILTANMTTANNGKPTVGQIVSFSVVDPGMNPIGFFLNNINTGPSDVNGNVQVSYSAGNTTYTGVLTVIATTAVPGSVPISGKTQIYLTN
jgi:hypothetical protein